MPQNEHIELFQKRCVTCEGDGGADACAAERDDSRVETFRGGNDADARLGVVRGAKPVRVTLSPSARFPGG